MARAVPGPINEVLRVHIQVRDTAIFHSDIKEAVELTLTSTIAASAGAILRRAKSSKSKDADYA